MVTWTDLAAENLAAAKQLILMHPRSAVSRAYYAVHLGLAERLVEAGYMSAKPAQTQPHAAQPALIKRYLGSIGVNSPRRLIKAVLRLLARRIYADYVRTVTVDRAMARDAVRDALDAFRILQLVRL